MKTAALWFALMAVGLAMLASLLLLVYQALDRFTG